MAVINYKAVRRSLKSLRSQVGSAMVGFIQSGTGAVKRWVQDKLRELPVSVEDFGAIGDGVTDDGAAFVAAATANRRVRLRRGAVYLFPAKQTISSITGLQIDFNGARIHATSYDGALEISDCPSVVLTDVDVYGDEDRVSWEALTTGERQVNRALVKITNSPKARVYGTNTSGFPSGLWVDSGCIDSVVVDAYHEGLGGDADTTLTDENFVGAAVIMRGTHNSEVRNPRGKYCAQVVLGLLSVENLRVFGGYGDQIHNVGVYISSGFDCLVEGFRGGYVKGDCVKARGSRNWIKDCHVEEGPADVGCGFVISGLSIAEAIDSEGANGHGGGIINCTAKDIGILANVRAVDIGGTDYYMRDVEVAGNQGFNLTSTTSSAITAWVQKRAKIHNNIIETFAATLAIQVLGKTAADATGIEVTDNAAHNGQRVAEVQIATAPNISRNYGESLTSNTVVRAVSCVAPIFHGNRCDDQTKAVDVRAATLSITGVASAVGNECLVQFDSTQQIFASLADNHSLSLMDTASVAPARRGQIVRSSATGNPVMIANGLTTADWAPVTGNTTATAANIAAVANTVNTTGKFTGKQVWDSTNNRMMRANGSAAADPWYVIDGSASVTPA